jgi:rhodanese-related sulfurtransferase
MLYDFRRFGAGCFERSRHSYDSTNKDDVILVMCRPGARSAAAVDELAKAGFVNAYSIVDGFEGDKLEASGRYRNGQRIVNGWKNSGAPWTYQLDPRIVYLP